MASISSVRINQARILIDYRFPETWRLNPRSGLRENARSGVSAECLQAAEEYMAELHSLSDQDFEEKFIGLRELIKAKISERRKEFLEIQKHNQALSNADFSYWLKLSRWKRDEAILLSLGKEPRMVRLADLENAAPFDPLRKAVRERREMIERAIGSIQLRDPMSPARFLGWAEKIGLELPSALTNSVKRVAEASQRPSSEADKLTAELEVLRADLDAAHRELAIHRAQAARHPGKSKSEGRDLSVRERTSLIKLVIGMAIGGYGHTPHSSRSPTVSAIVSDLAINGIPLDEDTVRKYLHEGRDLLPREKT